MQWPKPTEKGDVVGVDREGRCGGGTCNDQGVTGTRRRRRRDQWEEVARSGGGRCSDGSGLRGGRRRRLTKGDSDRPWPKPNEKGDMVESDREGRRRRDGESIDKSVIDKDVHVERSDQNHVMDRKNLVMTGLVFDEVSRMWVEKGPDKDQGGEGDGDKEKGSDNVDEKSGVVDPVPILNNGSEVRVTESVKEMEYEQIENFNTHFDEGNANQRGDLEGDEEQATKMKSKPLSLSSIEGHGAVTSPVKRVEKFNVESAQNETKLFRTFIIGLSSTSQQPSNLLRSLFDELKTKVENMLDRIENFLISLDGMVQKIIGAIFKIGRDVGAGMRTVHKDMRTLLKKDHRVWEEGINIKFIVVDKVANVSTLMEMRAMVNGDDNGVAVEREGDRSGTSVDERLATVGSVLMLLLLLLKIGAAAAPPEDRCCCSRNRLNTSVIDLREKEDRCSRNRLN
ncbi:hypothetical protein Syun_025093 [Stephania yunnanensis]|uniref:Uncharacterized protein n=1 Tax=Stephania yunnanensis TaxID=152371 RepID=A0AAP0EY41_9MAGN